MTTSPATASTSLAKSSPPSSFILGVPLGLEGLRAQEAPKQSRDVSAILPRVACLEFSASSPLLPASCAGAAAHAASSTTAPAVPAAKLASQLWAPNLGESKWRQLAPAELSSPAVGPNATSSSTKWIPQLCQDCGVHTAVDFTAVSATPVVTPERKAQAASVPEVSNVPAAGSSALPADRDKSLPPGQLLTEGVEQALRRPRTILSASSMHPTLPQRRLSVPTVRPATATARSASGPSTPGIVKASVVPRLLKIPPNRIPPSFKSVEDVVNERQREALARLEAAPAGLAVDDEWDETLLHELF